MMSSGRPVIALQQLLRRMKEETTIQDDETYQRLTIHLNNKGIDIRDEVPGHSIGTKKQFIVHAGQFLLSKIDARNGAFGIVPPGVRRGVITGNFWAYDVDETLLHPPYFNYLTHTPFFHEFCVRSSSGTTNRRYLQEGLFLAREIPLPPLHEQQRIVARVEALARRVKEAQGLRRASAKEAGTMMNSEAGRVFTSEAKRCESRCFGTFDPHVTSGPRYWSARYSESGARFYRAQDIGPEGRILEDSNVYVSVPENREGRAASLAPGDLMIIITGATVGRCAVFERKHELGYVSQHVAICRLPPDRVNPRYALWGLRSPLGQSQLLGQRYGQGKPGLNLTNIRNISMPFPSLEEQDRVVVYLDNLQSKVDQLHRLQIETQQELDALMPSILAKAFAGEL